MLEAPECSRAAEAGLNFVAGEQSVMRLGPLPQLLHILRRSEGRAAALVRLQDDASDIRPRDARVGQRLQERIERHVGGAESVGERNLHEAFVEVDNPLLERGDAAGLLRTQRASMERFLERHDDVLRAAADLNSVRARELDRTFDGLRSGGEQEHLLQRLWQQARQTLDKLRANLAREAIVVQETGGGLRGDGVD